MIAKHPPCASIAMVFNSLVMASICPGKKKLFDVMSKKVVTAEEPITLHAP